MPLKFLIFTKFPTEHLIILKTESNLGDVEHEHTGLELQYTTFDVEILRDPKLEITVYNTTHSHIKSVSI